MQSEIGQLLSLDGRHALVTGGATGIGEAIARVLAAAGATVVIGDVDVDGAERVATDIGGRAVELDVTDPDSADAAIAAVPDLDLLVNNASVLGPSPQPALADYPLTVLEHVYAVNVLAPLGLIQLALPRLGAGALILNVTSDAAVEPYPGWGGYGSSKAALEHLTRTLAAEVEGVGFVTVDPGDLRTQMHQDAFPGQDISDSPQPAEVVPALLHLLEQRLPSGRHSSSALGVPAGRPA